MWTPMPCSPQVGSGFQAFGWIPRRTPADHTGRLESAYGSEGWGFESLRARSAQRRFLPLWEAARLPIDDSFDDMTGGLWTCGPEEHLSESQAVAGSAFWDQFATTRRACRPTEDYTRDWR